MRSDEPPSSPPPSIRALKWEFFPPETLETLFVVYTHKLDLDWAERIWRVLEQAGLTQYSSATEFNCVVVRLAVLARFWKCWVWKADYGWTDDPFYEYEDWFESLPFIRAQLPSA